MRAWMVAAIVCAVALAGCSEAPSPEPTDDLPTRVIETGPDVGAISGVVVSQTIVPVAGVTVRIDSDALEVVTDADGQFVFEDLAPGNRFLEATAAGFQSARTSVNVVAGEVATARILMTADTTVQPVQYTLQHDGFIQFNGATSGPIINIILEAFMGSNPFCQCTLQFDTTGQDVRTLVVEAVWEDTIEYPNGPVDMYLEVFPAELDDGTSDIQGGFLTSPILEHYPIGLWGTNETNTAWNARLSGSGFFVQLDQPYQMFVTVFENAAAPSGWSLVGTT